MSPLPTNPCRQTYVLPEAEEVPSAAARKALNRCPYAHRPKAAARALSNQTLHVLLGGEVCQLTGQQDWSNRAAGGAAALHGPCSNSCWSC